MARYSIEGLGRLYHVPTIANIAAPTVAELNAGTSLTSFVPRDGFVPNLNQNFVDVSAINDTFDLTQIGSEGGSFTLTFYRDNGTDTAWNLYVASNVTGYLAWREGVAAATAWTIAQKVMIWPYSAHKPIPMGTASNEGRKFTVGVAIPTVPDRNATVA
jgi:hypothetical protein